jgi:hypothetical protein
MRGLSRISNEEELHQFLELWAKIDGVQLSEEQDQIHWLLCASGKYSAKSAYEFQFHDRLLQPHLEKL